MNDPGDKADPTRPYVLGHSDRELDRLKAQAHSIDPITQRFFKEAGIVPGMRVLDVGSGAGDVAFLAADMVGTAGNTVGVDRVPAAVEAATARAVARSLPNVVFREGDPADISLDGPFDAVVGRYVLQFQRDPSAMLWTLSRHLSPGGLVVFHEIDWGGIGSYPPAPTFDRCWRWCVDTLRLHGTETRMGTKLHSTFVAAGLPSPSLRLEALIGGPATSPMLLQLFADLVATLLPEMERFGVATPADAELETLVERMTNEAIATSSVIVGHSQIAAWCRV